MRSNWNSDHWTNLGLFLSVLLLTGLGTVTTWDQIPARITPAAVSSFGLAVATFLKTMYTNKPRDPQFGTRSTDPNATVPVVEKRSLGGGTTLVPAVVETPGRPVDPNPPQTK